jgi:hypothetical protein
MLEDVIERRHFAVAIVVLEAYLNLKDDMKQKMTLSNLDETLQKRILLFLDLVKYPVQEWNFEKNFAELSNLTCYLLSMLVRRIEDMETCFTELEKLMKKEWDDGIMTKERYMFHRRTNFELKRIIWRLNLNDYYNITYHNENHMKIIYKHIV